MRVFTIPPSAPFLRTLIAALVDGRLIDGFEARTAPHRLADATLYLPTQRAGRLAREVFLDVLQADAVLLPRIVILGDIDEDELVFADPASQESGIDGRGVLDLPDALGGLDRILALAQLIAAWTKAVDQAADTPLVVSGPASAMALAGDLARLMDDMVTRGVAWDALDTLVPEEHDVYWQMTLKFLRIAREWWPAHLKAMNRIEPAERRRLLIEAETKRLLAHRGGPVIAAGSTGSTPATAQFLDAVARLPDGAVVLPGLDTDLDDETWRAIDNDEDAAPSASAPAFSHPQFALHHLLTRFGISRRDVMQLTERAVHGRELLLSEAMRPAHATAQWHRRLQDAAVHAQIVSGLQNLAVIEAPGSEMEALAIAVALREAVEADLSAALVTPDRTLARRVMAALDRWHVDVDDSGGDPVTETPHGRFARLITVAVAEQFAPAPLLALLKHPLLRLGREAHALAPAIATLELAVLRGTRPPPGLTGLMRDFTQFRAELTSLDRGEPSALHRSEPRAQLKPPALDAVQRLLDQLIAAFAPLTGLDRAASHDFAELVRRHRDVIEALSRDPDENVTAVMEGAGTALSAALNEATIQPATGLAVRLDEYPDVFDTAFATRIVRRPENSAARVRIYGTLEARLTTTDRVVLGGLTEGIWPPEPRTDAWLSRPMRHQLGLDLPERRIGLSAHDFVQLVGAPEVILSHASKVGGSPAVASRFLQRLQAVAGPERWQAARQRGDTYLNYAGELDRPAEVTPMPQPAPAPPRDARPLMLSVTEIEDWLRDPYTIYARHILKLAPLDPLDMPLSAADRGSAIHAALGDFTERFAAGLPDDPDRILQEIGRQHFAPLMERPEARALWWPRFQRIASWFIGWEMERRIDVRNIDAEVRGRLSIALDATRSFVLTSRADRIEHRADRTFAVVDYKTGVPPTGKQVRIGLSPQLTLEAAILREGGFADIPHGASVSELVYVRLSGNSPPGKATVLELKRDRNDEPLFPDDAADQARRKLEELVRRFDNGTEPYRSLSLSMWSNRYGRYDDLARIKEWAAAGRADGGEA